MNIRLMIIEKVMNKDEVIILKEVICTNASL